MTKKKTSVVLPGGIASLVHQVQGGADAERNKPAEKAAEENAAEEKTNSAEQQNVQAPAPEAERTAEKPASDRTSATKKEQINGVGESESSSESTSKGRRGRPAAPKEAQTPTEKAEREYHIVKDSGADSWDLFLSLGRIYKTRDERLATIYIDPDLKRILDRLKTASNVKLPTAAILSSIVARFIFDHEKKINEVIFGERLI